MAEIGGKPGIISAEDLAGVARWEPARLDGAAINAEQIDARRRPEPDAETAPELASEPALEESVEPLPKVTAEELAAIRQAAYEEGYSEGLTTGEAEGRRRGEAAALQQAEQWRSLVEGLQAPLAAEAEAVEQELLRLAIAIASQLVRRELRQDPGQIIAVIREAMALLPSMQQRVRVALHPDDAKLVRETFSLGSEERSWQVTDDPAISRGGCRIATDTSNLDATLETRIAALVAGLLGGARELDDDGAA